MNNILKVLKLVVEDFKNKEIWLEDYSLELNGEIYGFITENDTWEDDGKYQYKIDKGAFAKFDENFNAIEEYPYGISRQISRTGSYYSDYYYDYNDPEIFEIKSITIPEKIIPAHEEEVWEEIKI